MFKIINLSAIIATLILSGTARSANLVARYVLDGTADDTSGNAYHGVNTDATFVVDGVRGTVASFDGLTSSIDLSATAYSLGDLPNGQFSAAFWILPTVNNGANTTPDTLVIMGGNSPGKGVIEIVGDTSWGGMGGGSAQGGVGVNSGGGGGKTGKVDTIDLYDGLWHHVVIQWAGDPNTDIEVWIDNTVATTYGNGYNGSSNATTALRLGGPAVWSNGGAADKYYTGLMSDVQIFDAQLTTTEVNNVFTTGSVTPSSLILDPVSVTSVAYNEAEVACTVNLATDAVTVYWGTSDPGETDVGWTGAPIVLVGQSAGPVPATINGLSENTPYFFRYFGSITSPAEDDWSSVGTFTTPFQDPAPLLGTPSATTTYLDGADVECPLLDADATSTWVVWDTTDQGTPATPPGTWANSSDLGTALENDTLMETITGAPSDTTYVFRFFASSASGSDWSELGTFDTEAPPASATLVAHYLLDGDSKDSSGNSYHGVDTDMSYVVDGVRGTVASFDGLTGSINLTTAFPYSLGDLPNGGFSTSFWILPTVDNGDNATPDTLVIMGGSAPGKGVIEIVGDTSWGGMGGGSAQGGVGVNSGGGGGKTGKVGTIDLYDGGWHHVVIQWAGDPNTDLEVWIDNTVATTSGNGYNGSSDATTALRLGGPAVWSNGGAADKYFTGRMSDVRFFTGQLNASEVNDLFTGGSVTPSGLVLAIVHNATTDQLTFTWNGEGGKTYNILGNADLSTAPSTWTAVTGLSGVTSPQSIARSAATQYYVVEEAP